jgi:hypothetical protein
MTANNLFAPIHHNRIHKTKPLDRVSNLPDLPWRMRPRVVVPNFKLGNGQVLDLAVLENKGAWNCVFLKCCAHKCSPVPTRTRFRAAVSVCANAPKKIVG